VWEQRPKAVSSLGSVNPENEKQDAEAQICPATPGCGDHDPKKSCC